MTEDRVFEDCSERIRRYIMVKTPIQPADLAFVFGTRDGIEEFADTIAEHWRERYFSTIVVAGGTTHGNPQPESDVLRDELIRRGVSETCSG